MEVFFRLPWIGILIVQAELSSTRGGVMAGIDSATVLVYGKGGSIRLLALTCLMLWPTFPVNDWHHWNKSFFFRQIDTNQIVSAASRSLSVVGCLLITGTFPELCNLHHHSRKRVNDVDPRMADFSWLKNISIKKSHWMLDLKVLGANMLWRSYIGGMPD